MSYKHLTTNERDCIAVNLGKGLGIREIAKLLNRSPSTISREISRNKNNRGQYYAIGANRKSNKRKKVARKKSVLSTNPDLYYFILVCLQSYWSPEQIANFVPKEYGVSTSTIYRALKKNLFPKIAKQKLRRYRRKKKGSKKGACYDFSAVRKFEERPLSVLSRKEFGHWELDTIVLYCGENGYLATMVERKTRYTIIVRIPNKKSTTMADAIITALGKFPKKAVKSLTVDRGLEFADWERLEKELDTKVYFCDPYSPEQKPTVENTNGLIRQFYPRRKKCDFSMDASLVAELLNSRPRKVLNWSSPVAAFLLHLD